MIRNHVKEIHTEYLERAAQNSTKNSNYFKIKTTPPEVCAIFNRVLFVYYLC